MLEGLRTLWHNPYVRGLIALLALYGLYLFVHLTGDIWAVFLGAALLAALLRPAVNRLVALRIPQGLSVVVVLLALAFLVGLFGAMLVLVAKQVGSFARTSLPGAAGGVVAWWKQLPGQLHQSGLPDWMVGALEQAYGSLGQLIGSLVERLVSDLGRFAQSGLFPALSSVAGGALKLASFVVLFAYLLADGPRMGRAILARVPRSYLPRLEQAFDYLERAVIGYFRGQFLVALSMGLVVGLGLRLLGLPLALPVAVLVGLFELVPYLGVALGAVLVLFATLPLGWLAVLKAVAVLLLAAQVEGHLLAPLIVGHSTALHPVTVLLALLLGERLAGIGGMLVAVPLVAFARLWLDYLCPSETAPPDEGHR